MKLLLVWKERSGVFGVLRDNYSNRKDTHTDLLEVMGPIQSRTGKIPTLDDALKGLLENCKKKARS